jgi:hypothetical protein
MAMMKGRADRKTTIVTSRFDEDVLIGTSRHTRLLLGQLTAVPPDMHRLFVVIPPSASIFVKIAHGIEAMRFVLIGFLMRVVSPSTNIS